jgi:hypothetical protein
MTYTARKGRTALQCDGRGQASLEPVRYLAYDLGQKKSG